MHIIESIANCNIALLSINTCTVLPFLLQFQTCLLAVLKDFNHTSGNALF